jgi:hypothetical protein
LKRVDVIYRRIDDDFIDPLAFRADFDIGLAGRIQRLPCRKCCDRQCAGHGIADDKAVYAYVPRLIRYYLAEEPILASVETFLCREPKSLSHVLANLDTLVVKAVGESGGYGMLVGPHASKAEREIFAEKAQSRSGQLHCPANDPAFDGALFRGRRHRTAPCRSATLHPAWRADDDRAGSTDAGGAETRQPGGQFQPGRRIERYLGAEHMTVVRPDAEPGRGQSLLDEPLSRARGAHQPALARSSSKRLLEQTPREAELSWRRVVTALSGDEFVPSAAADAFEITRALAFDPANASSLIASLRFARDNARQVREQISTEMWNQLNRLYLRLTPIQLANIWNDQPVIFSEKPSKTC